MAQEGMFWKLVPEDVLGEPAEITSADDGFMWRVKKDKMEVATGVTWTQSEYGPRTLQLRTDPVTVAHSVGMQMFNQNPSFPPR